MKLRKIAAVLGAALLFAVPPVFAEEEIDDYDYFEEPDDNTITRAKNTPSQSRAPYDDEIEEDDSADGWFFRGESEQYRKETEEYDQEEQERLNREEEEAAAAQKRAEKAAKKQQQTIEKKQKQRLKQREKDAKSVQKKAEREEKRLDKEARKEQKAIEKDEKANRKFAQKQRTRYVKLFKDNDFTYYMDSSTAQWTKVPYSAESQMIDVWIQLVEGDNRAVISTETKEDEAGEYETKRANYTPPAKYFLEHYYIWPERKKIQFLCELDVTGKPDNVIDERKYDIKNWENLVPGSIEDNIFHSVVARMNKKHSILGIPTQGRSGRDMLEEYGRISL